MIPSKLRLFNFTSYGQNPPELDFSKFHLAAISGLNGAGKSSLLDAITWCLWGTSRAGDSADALVRLGQEEMWVELEFLLEGHKYIVKRRRSKKGSGSTALEFWSGANNLTEGTIKTTQEKITDTLHLSYETFTNSAFIRQGHADEFTTKGPSERKRILADILGLDHYDALEEKAKEKAKDAAAKIHLLEYQLIELEAELSQKEQNQTKAKEAEEKITGLEKAITELEKEIKIIQESKQALTLKGDQKNKLEGDFLQNKQELEEITNQGKNRSARIKDLEEKIKALPEIEKSLNSLKDLQKQSDELEAKRLQVLEFKKEISDLQGELALRQEQKKQFQQQIDKLGAQLKDLSKEGAKCPTCGQEVGKNHKLKVKGELNEQKEALQKKLSEIITNDLEKKLNDKRNQLSKISFDESKHQKTKMKLQELDSLQMKREELLKASATLDTEKKTLFELRDLFKKKQLQVQTQQQELEKLPNVSIKLSEISLQLSDKENQLNSLRNQEKEAQNIFGAVNELISRTKQMENLQKERQAEKSKLQTEKTNFEELSLAFGKKGIQAMIIENAIPEIEDEANKLLDKLTDGRMKVRFETQKETKTKVLGEDGQKVYGTVETLDIIISDEMGERSYELYSGGEVFRVNFSIRLAISKLLTNRAGAKLQFLVVDEGFGTQDAQGRSRVVEVLDTIKDDFEKILVITHLEELKEEFPVRIEVTKNADGSTFEIVGA